MASFKVISFESRCHHNPHIQSVTSNEINLNNFQNDIICDNYMIAASRYIQVWIGSNRCFSNDNDFKNPSGYRRQGGVFVCVNYKVMQEKATVIQLAKTNFTYNKLHVHSVIVHGSSCSKIMRSFVWYFKIKSVIYITTLKINACTTLLGMHKSQLGHQKSYPYQSGAKWLS